MDNILTHSSKRRDQMLSKLLLTAASKNFGSKDVQIDQAQNNEKKIDIKQDAVVAYIWAWLYYAYVKFVMCMRDMWLVQWYCIFKGLVEMCLITKMMGVVCGVVAGFLQGVVLLDVDKRVKLC